LYYVSLKGVTGAVLSDYDSVKKNITRLRDLTGLPIVIGFGIKDRESVKAMGGLADGVVIGSALVNKIAELPRSSVHTQDDINECTNLIGVARKALNSNN
jgi:tryptophan synthase alpha chain